MKEVAKYWSSLDCVCATTGKTIIQKYAIRIGISNLIYNSLL